MQADRRAGEGVSPIALADRNIGPCSAGQCWCSLNCSNDDFIRTTEEAPQALRAGICRRRGWRPRATSISAITERLVFGAVRKPISTEGRDKVSARDAVRQRGRSVRRSNGWREESLLVSVVSALWATSLCNSMTRTRVFRSPRERLNDGWRASCKSGSEEDLSISPHDIRLAVPCAGQLGKHVNVMSEVDFPPVLTQLLTAAAFRRTADRWRTTWPATHTESGKTSSASDAGLLHCLSSLSRAAVCSQGVRHGVPAGLRGEKMSKSIGNVVDTFRP